MKKKRYAEEDSAGNAVYRRKKRRRRRVWPIPVLAGLLVAVAVVAVSFVLPPTGRETAEPETVSPSPSPVSTQSGEETQ